MKKIQSNLGFNKAAGFEFCLRAAHLNVRLLKKKPVSLHSGFNADINAYRMFIHIMADGFSQSQITGTTI